MSSKKNDHKEDKENKIISFLKNNWEHLALLTIITLGVYFNSLKSEFLSDDIPAIVQNENTGNFIYFLRTQPLTFVRYFTYSIVYNIFGLKPIFFNLMNISFHLGTVWLTYILVTLLINPITALIACAFLAIHPIQSEVVNWISGGVHIEYSFFLILSFLLYVIAKRNNWLKKFYITSIFFFLTAVLTTEKAIILPLIILAYEVIFYKKEILKNLKRIIPFFSISILWVIIFFSTGRIDTRLLDLGATGLQGGKFYNPFFQIPVAISSYLKLIIWPQALTLYHSEIVFPLGKYLLALFVFLAFIALIIWSYKKNKQIFFWGLFFLISLIPMLTPFKVAWIVAERYVYLGAIGIFVIIAILIQKAGKFIKNKNIIWVFLAVIIIALSTRTIIRNKDWETADYLWISTAKYSPHSSQNHNNLGDLFSRRGEYEKAIQEFEIAISLKSNYSDAYHNLGNTYLHIGEYEKAFESYQKAISFNPYLWQSHQNLAGLYFEKEDYNNAEEHFKKAIQVNPSNDELYANLGIVYIKKGEYEKAKTNFEQALQLNPQNKKASQLLLSL